MIYFLVILLISGGLLGYWYFFDQSPVEQPQKQYTKPVLNYQAVNWDDFHNNLMRIGHIGFFEQYPLQMYADILGIDVLGLKEKYNNADGFEKLTHDLTQKFSEDNSIFQNFCDQMERDELNLNLMPIEFNFDHSSFDHHYDSGFDHNNFDNRF